MMDRGLVSYEINGVCNVSELVRVFFVLERIWGAFLIL